MAMMISSILTVPITSHLIHLNHANNLSSRTSNPKISILRFPKEISFKLKNDLGYKNNESYKCHFLNKNEIENVKEKEKEGEEEESVFMVFQNHASENKNKNNIFLFPLALMISASFLFAMPAHAQNLSFENENFQKSCAGCHAGGGNIIKSGAGLTLDELAKNNYETAESIYSITYFGKRRMPGFGQNCAPKGQCTFGLRLSDETIMSLSNFVLENARNGWK